MHNLVFVPLGGCDGRGDVHPHSKSSSVTSLITLCRDREACPTCVIQSVLEPKDLFH